jgi:hypothetical protein
MAGRGLLCLPQDRLGRVVAAAGTGPDAGVEVVRQLGVSTRDPGDGVPDPGRRGFPRPLGFRAEAAGPAAEAGRGAQFPYQELTTVISRPGAARRIARSRVPFPSVTSASPAAEAKPPHPSLTAEHVPGAQIGGRVHSTTRSVAPAVSKCGKSRLLTASIQELILVRRARADAC